VILMTIRVLLIIAIAIVALAIAVEVFGWLRGTRLTTKRQKFYRLTAALMLEAIFLMAIFGKSLASRNDPILEIGYWGIVIILSFIILILALLDVREMLALYRQHRSELLASLLSGQIQAPKLSGQANLEAEKKEET